MDQELVPEKMIFGNDVVTNTPKGQVITVDQLKPATPITLPQSDFNATGADSLVAGVAAGQGSLDTFLQSLTPKETALDQSQNAIISRLNDLLPQSAGRTQALAQEQQNQGIPQLQKQLQDLNNQINIGNAEYTKLALEAEAKKAALEANSRGITTSVLTGQQGAVERQALAERAVKAAEIGMKAAQAQAVSGNINTAIQLAQNAVEARYAPIEDELRIRQAQLDAIQPLLNKQEKQQALAQQVMIQDRQNAIEAQKEKEKQVNNIMVEAAKYGADQQTLERIRNSGSVGEAIKNSGDFLSAEFKAKMDQIKFDNQMQLQQLAISRGNLAVAQGNLALRKQEIEDAKAANMITPDGQVSPELLAYAQQYASTGKIPTGLPKGTFGLVSAAAKSLPKPDGTLVNINTGIMPDGLSATQADGIIAMYDLTKKLSEAQELFKTFKTGIIAGTFNKILPSDEQTKYNTLRGEIVDLLARARSGAALTVDEVKNYEGKIPSRFVKGAWTGPSGENLLSGLKSSIEGKLNTTLQANGAAIYGFSKVKMPDGKMYTVGSNIESEGKRYRIDPDGNLTPIN